jgi:predicted short-subunit dehydrogenase-like oxidoreductase (DUF2520 family)
MMPRTSGRLRETHYNPASPENLRIMAPANKRNSKPSVSIVGSGRLGTALALALAAAGYSIEVMVARQRRHAVKAARLIGSRTSALGVDELRLLPPSKVIFIATPDDEIGNVSEKLAGLTSGRITGRFVLHTSGALSAEILAPLAAAGFRVGSLHPLISVSDPRSGVKTLSGAFYCIEGDPSAIRMAQTIVRDLKGQSFTIPRESKPLYHAAAVMASGHVVALFDLAVQMLMECGLTRSQARRVLMPLLESTVNNLAITDPARAMTGTFARGDLATVLRHLQSLSKGGSTQALEAYRTLGIHALDLMQRNGAEPRVASEIRKVLGA